MKRIAPVLLLLTVVGCSSLKPLAPSPVAPAASAPQPLADALSAEPGAASDPGLTDAEITLRDREAAALDAKMSTMVPKAGTVDDCPKGTTKTAATHATVDDVALPILRHTGFAWFRGCTATQTQIRMLQDTLFALIPEAINFADALPNCPLKTEVQHFAGIVPRYKAICRTSLCQFDRCPIYGDLCGGSCSEHDRKPWRYKAGSTDYSGAQYLVRGLQACAVSTANRGVCGKILTPTVATLAGIKKDTAGNCVINVAASTGTLPKEKFMSGRVVLGMATGECLGPMNSTTHHCRTIHAPPLSAKSMALLHATHAAHSCTSDVHCGIPHPEGCPSASAAHLAYEDDAIDEEEHGFRTPPTFFGKVDPRLSKQDECTAFRIVDDCHMEWMKCEEAGDWACADRAGKCHRDGHILIGTADPRLQIVAPGEPSDPTYANLIGVCAQQPHLTLRQWIDEYRASHPEHRNELARMNAGSPLL